MGRLFWITQEDPKCNDKYPYDMEKEGDWTFEEEKVMWRRSTGWTEVTINQAMLTMLASIKSWERQGIDSPLDLPEGTRPRDQHIHFNL